MPDSIDGSQPLRNNRQELFCQYLTAGETKTNAYIKAGYIDSEYSKHNCQTLWRRNHIQLRYNHLMAQIAADVRKTATIVTVGTLTVEADEALDMAREQGHTSAIASLLAFKAKVNGLLTDKVETKESAPELTAEEEQYQREYAAWRLDQEAAKARHTRPEDGPGRPNGEAGGTDSPRGSIKLYGT